MFQKWVDHFEEQDTNVIVYVGPIDRSGYDLFCDAIPKKADRKKKLLLVLCTFGGNPNAGYRIARAAIHNYGSENFSVLIPAECKSAGTLVCIGAKRLIMLNKGELGPLDVQMQKKDEIFEQSSGLDIIRGVAYLQQEALSSFNQYLIDINSNGGLSTKLASEISSKLVIGLYEPMFAQVDPMRLGEMSAALQIAFEYGNRLNAKSNVLKNAALQRLINSYPAHGFVIDRSEAREIFERVDAPSEIEIELGRAVDTFLWKKGRETKAVVTDFIQYLYDQKVIKKESHDEPGNANGAPPDSGERGDGQPQDPVDGNGIPDGQPAGEPEHQQSPVGDEPHAAGADRGTPDRVEPEPPVNGVDRAPPPEDGADRPQP